MVRYADISMSIQTTVSIVLLLEMHSFYIVFGRYKPCYCICRWTFHRIFGLLKHWWFWRTISITPHTNAHITISPRESWIFFVIRLRFPHFAIGHCRIALSKANLPSIAIPIHVFIIQNQGESSEPKIQVLRRHIFTNFVYNCYALCDKGKLIKVHLPFNWHGCHVVARNDNGEVFDVVQGSAELKIPNLVVAIEFNHHLQKHDLQYCNTGRCFMFCPAI